MQKHRDVVTDVSGNAITNAVVSVRNYPSGTTATIYSDNGVTQKPYSFAVSSFDGSYEFYAPNGRYTIDAVAIGFNDKQFVDIGIFDPTHLDVTDKAEAAALPLTQYDDGVKVFITSADGGEFTVRYNATPGTYADDGGSFCGTQFIPTGGDGTIGIVRDNVTEILAAWFGVTGSGTETTEVDAAFAAATDVPMDMAGLTATTGALTTTGKTLTWPFGRYTSDQTSPVALDAADLSAVPALTYTNESRHGYSHRFGNLTANDVYSPIFPNINNWDTFNAVTDINSGSTIEHIAALGGYIKNNSANSNGVALFGVGMGTAQNTATWGLNTLLQDQATRVVGTLTGMVLANELDFNVMNPGTEVIGLSLGGNSLAQPTAANAFLANSLGTGIKWTTGFYALDGACTNAFVAGLGGAAGANVASSKILLQSTDGSSVKQTATIDAQAGAFVILSGMGFKVASNNILLDTGQFYIVNGLGVLGDRKTGWGAPTGTATRTTFATSTVTLPQLAERVKALIDDLTTHGMIGA